MMQIFASVAVLLGLFLYGRKSIHGPIISIVACIAWAAIAMCADMWPMAGLNVVLILIHLFNLYKWSFHE